MVELLGDSERPNCDDELAESTDGKLIRVDSVDENGSRVDSADEKGFRVDSVDDKWARDDSVKQKRIRVDSDTSTGERRVRVDSSELTNEKEILVGVTSSGDMKRSRDGFYDETDVDSSLAKRLRDDLLGEVDDSETDPPSQDLDSVMRSFECELSASVTVQSSDAPQPDLGYLLEASDDELGLPPPPSTTESVVDSVRVSSDSSGIGELWGFDDPIPSYNSIEFDTDELAHTPIDGLFDKSDADAGAGLESPDLLSWRQESLPAAD